MNQAQVLYNYENTYFGNCNEELLSFREKDDMVAHLDEFFKEISKYYNQNINYKGYSEIKNIARINELNSSNSTNINKIKKKNNNKKTILEVDSKETYYKVVEFYFDLTYKKVFNDGTFKIDKSKFKMPLYIPIIDGYSYLIRGSKYVAPIQLIDSLFFSKSNILILKVMNRAIKMSKSSKILIDIKKRKYHTDCFYLHVVSKKISFLLYFWAYQGLGFYKTMKYFGADKFIEVVKLDTNEILNPNLLPDDYLFFKFGMVYLKVDKAEFEKNLKLRQFVASTLALSKRNMDADSISQISRWQIMLSNTVSETQAIIKGRQIINTFVTALDSRTRMIIEKFIEGGENLQNMHAIIKWMFLKFQPLIQHSGNHLNNKRMRYSEYLIQPIIEIITKKAEKFANTSNKLKDINRVEDIFKIPRPIILYSINSASVKTAINIINYSDKVNDNAYQIISKITLKGPGTAASSKNNIIPVEYKSLDFSHVGTLNLNGSSGEMGLDMYIVPFAKINMNKNTFAEHSKKIGNFN